MAPEDLARRLAYLFLSAPWQRDELLLAARSALDGEPQWLPNLVDRLVGSLPEKPADRPDELAAVIMGQNAYVEGSHADGERGIEWRVRSFPNGGLADESERMAVPDWPVPRLGTDRALADLLRVDLPIMLWLADPNSYLRRARDPGLLPYRYHWVRRRDRTPRLLEAPGPLLRLVQRRLLDRVLSHIPPHPTAYDFVRGRDVVAGARPHTGADWVLGFDLTSFFAQVREGRIRGIVRTAGYPESVARLMASIMTTATPVATLARMPTDGRDDDRAVLRAALRMSHLPQGAPTSTAIANLACYRLDVRLDRLAQELDLCYTRYADDLVFSGSGRWPGQRFVRLVRRIVDDEGYRLNGRKQRLQTRRGRQLVTGVVVNDLTNMTRPEFDRLRAIIHDAVVNGPEHANRDHHPNFRSHLDGKINWVEQLNPSRGTRLRRQFDLITWPQSHQPRAG